MTSCEEEWWSDADEEALAAIDVDTATATATTTVTGVTTATNLIGSEFLSENEFVLPSKKYTLECDQILQSEGSPLERYRPKYLIVSDMASQHWCEQKLLYDFSVEVYMKRIPAGIEVKVEEDLETKALKGKGSDIHLARELEIQVPVEVPVETKEDRWAIKFLNLYVAVHGFYHNCLIAREVPVFGCPFESDIFVYGIVDELQYDPSTDSVKLSELKTRRSNYPPKKSHQEKDIFQVGLYRQLFDELVMNKVTKAMVGDHLGLDLSRSLSAGVVAHIGEDIMSQHQDGQPSMMNLDHLLDFVFDQIQSMTRIQSGQVEYVNQDTKLPIVIIELDKDEAEIRSMFEESARWWKGERGTKGVDIEDCWKCNFCTYSPWCEWRDVMAEKTQARRKEQNMKTGS